MSHTTTPQDGKLTEPSVTTADVEQQVQVADGKDIALEPIQPSTSSATNGELNLTRTETPGPEYSVFSRGRRRWIIFMAAVASFVSPMTATIYYPALVPLSRDLNVSISLINLTVTSYMIFQAIIPSIYGDLGDTAGRRPALFLSFTIYLVANIGLALQRSYPALLVLRMIQACGNSGTIALGFAVVADLVTSSERGKYMGIIYCGINVGPTLSPVLGGIFSAYLGWPSIFWFSAILAVVWLVPFLFAVPETCRAVVGNGSIPPQRWNRTLFEIIKGRKEPPGQAIERPKLRFPNPIYTLKIIFNKEMSLILLYSSILYLDFVIVAATLGTLFQKTYGFSDLEVGLCYLPYGAGCCISSVGQGYILDWNYRRVASKVGFKIDRRRGDNLLNFPLEKARLETVTPVIVLGVGTLISYGWVLQAKASVAVPLVLQFIIGLCFPGSFSVMNTLIVDLHPKAPATASAANNMARCLLGAAGTAFIEPLFLKIGYGWSFTIFGALPALLCPLLFVIQKYGPRWRKEKHAAEEDGE
ncbi:unnamed protein product [Clonostachys solani]|uniref:Major facilitator superfamily (MFS) profile domain-containing protein n=1 Tax=Clonostachys solani TaxID=160281 RepID=A0A9N9W6A0_9HYPO|nr:unnamed protein product [Clonostachys solani]